MNIKDVKLKRLLMEAEYHQDIPGGYIGLSFNRDLQPSEKEILVIWLHQMTDSLEKRIH